MPYRFERFTVGNRAHNEGDIKKLAKVCNLGYTIYMFILRHIASCSYCDNTRYRVYVHIRKERASPSVGSSRAKGKIPCLRSTNVCMCCTCVCCTCVCPSCHISHIQGLMNCKETHETFNADLVTPGIIFSDVNETLWTVTPGKPSSNSQCTVT